MGVGASGLGCRGSSCPSSKYDSLPIWQGLVVPVIRNAHSMSWAEIETEIANLGNKAKTGALTVEDMVGGASKRKLPYQEPAT